MSNHFSGAFARPRRLERQRGAVAIIVGLTIPVLIGFVGLALDLGKLYIAKTELQNSSDACALAASRELTGANTDQLTVAEAAGITTGSTNMVMFQSEPVENIDVTFSQSLSGAYLPKGDYGPTEALAVKYVRCTATRTDIPTWFMQVLNLLPGVSIGQQTVAATAVASLVASQTNCAIPVALCSTAVAGKPAGTWLEGVRGSGPGGNMMSGSFQWADLDPDDGGGASELGSQLTESGECNMASVGEDVGQPGAIGSLSDEWNSRFGIYRGSTPVGSGVPDFTGFSYTESNWSPVTGNAYGDFRSKRAANAAYQGDALTGLKAEQGNATIQPSSYLQAQGADRRVAVAPVVDCLDLASGTTAPVESYACILMLHPLNNSPNPGTGGTRMYLEYLGQANDPGSPCATLGVPAAPGSPGPLVSVLSQ